jgi:hypothetical protein
VRGATAYPAAPSDGGVQRPWTSAGDAWTRCARTWLPSGAGAPPIKELQVWIQRFHLLQGVGCDDCPGGRRASQASSAGRGCRCDLNVDERDAGPVHDPFEDRHGRAPVGRDDRVSVIDLRLAHDPARRFGDRS